MKMGPSHTRILTIIGFIFIYETCGKNVTDQDFVEKTQKCLQNGDATFLKTRLEAVTKYAVELQLDLEGWTERSIQSQTSNFSVADFLDELKQLEYFIDNFIKNGSNTKVVTMKMEDNSDWNQNVGDLEMFKLSLVNLNKEVQHLREEFAHLVTQDGSNFHQEDVKMMALAEEISSIQTNLVFLQDNITFVTISTGRLMDELTMRKSDVDELNKLVITVSSSMATEMSRMQRNLTSLQLRLNQLSVDLDKKSLSEFKQHVLKDIQDSETKDNAINPKTGQAGIPRGFFSSFLSLGGIKENVETVPKSTSNHGDSQNRTADIEEMEEKLVKLEENYEKLTSDLNKRLLSLEKELEDKGKVVKNITKETCNGARRHLVGDSCYFVPDIYTSDHQFTWWDARYLCKHPENLGPEADLVSIETKEKMEGIVKMLSNHFGGIEEFWLGASDLEEEGHWIWSRTGQTLNKDGYTKWQHPPGNNTEMNCMSMFPGYEWGAEPCFYERYPLCELKLWS